MHVRCIFLLDAMFTACLDSGCLKDARFDKVQSENSNTGMRVPFLSWAYDLQMCRPLGGYLIGVVIYQTKVDTVKVVNLANIKFDDFFQIRQINHFYSTYPLHF